MPVEQVKLINHIIHTGVVNYLKNQTFADWDFSAYWKKYSIFGDKKKSISGPSGKVRAKKYLTIAIFDSAHWEYVALKNLIFLNLLIKENGQQCMNSIARASQEIISANAEHSLEECWRQIVTVSLDELQALKMAENYKKFCTKKNSNDISRQAWNLIEFYFTQDTYKTQVEKTDAQSLYCIQELSKLYFQSNFLVDSPLYHFLMQELEFSHEVYERICPAIIS